MTWLIASALKLPLPFVACSPSCILTIYLVCTWNHCCRCCCCCWYSVHHCLACHACCIFCSRQPLLVQQNNHMYLSFFYTLAAAHINDQLFPAEAEEGENFSWGLRKLFSVNNANIITGVVILLIKKNKIMLFSFNRSLIFIFGYIGGKETQGHHCNTALDVSEKSFSWRRTWLFWSCSFVFERCFNVLARQFPKG